MARRVLVIGGNRFLGRRLVWRLVARGDEVTLFNRGTLADPFGGRVERLHGDRTGLDLPRLLAGREFEAAVDFAAFTDADVRGAVEALQARIGHYVLISTGQVYLVREVCPRPAREEDYEGPLMPEPTNTSDREQWAYGMGKRAAEDVLAEAWTRARFPATRLRIPIVNGERDHTRRLEGYLWRLLDGGPLLLPSGSPGPVRHVYAGAVVRAIDALLGRADTHGRAFNLAQQETPALPELLEVLSELLGSTLRLVPVARERLVEAGLDPLAVSPFSGTWMSFLDPARARAELGFQHEPLREYLGRVVESFLAHTPETPPPAYAGRRRELELARGLME